MPLYECMHACILGNDNFNIYKEKKISIIVHKKTIVHHSFFLKKQLERFFHLFFPTFLTCTLFQLGFPKLIWFLVVEISWWLQIYNCLIIRVILIARFAFLSVLRQCIILCFLPKKKKNNIISITKIGLKSLSQS